MVLAKADLRPASDAPAVSGVTGEGLDALLARVGAMLEGRAARAGTVSHERQRQAIERAADGVAAACGGAGAAGAAGRAGGGGAARRPCGRLISWSAEWM